MIIYKFNSPDKMITYGIGLENIYTREKVVYTILYTVGITYEIYVWIN